MAERMVERMVVKMDSLFSWGSYVPEYGKCFHMAPPGIQIAPIQYSEGGVLSTNNSFGILLGLLGVLLESHQTVST